MPCLTLKIRGLGHVPAFKNHKLLTRGRLRTDPRKQKWMALCIQSIESQLRCLLATADAGMETGQLARSLIAWSQQFDDSLDWIPEHHCACRMVEKGQEGAEIALSHHNGTFEP